MKLTLRLINEKTNTSLGDGELISIVKSDDKTNEPIGAGFITDETGTAVITSALLDSGYDLYIAPKGYEPKRLVKTEFKNGDVKLTEKGKIFKDIANKGIGHLKEIPAWAWQAGGITLVAVGLIVFISKKVK